MLSSLLLLVVAAAPRVVSAQKLSDGQINVVVERLAEGATHSWEIGTRAQTLLELNSPRYSVLNTSSIPPPQSPPRSLGDVLGIAASIVRARNNSNSGPQPLIPDGSAADPASNGVAVLLANWTGQTNSSLDFEGAARDQLEFLFTRVPRTQDGALSHRTEEVQLWSDYVYMVPPFLAYYGVLTTNRTLLLEAYNQCRLYRQYLLDPDAGNLWKHIVESNGLRDEGHWSTGNGWAAAGMLRVLGTIQNSDFRNTMRAEMDDLGSWISEIHDAMFPHLQSNNLFNNYADDSNSFPDAASTALLAATVYRTALLTNTHTHLPIAERIRRTLSSSSGSGSGTGTDPNSSSLANMKHFTSDGWLTPVVNPNSFSQEGEKSPEGQAFIVQMQAAYTDWVENGSVGANGGSRAFPRPTRKTYVSVGAFMGLFGASMV